MTDQSTAREMINSMNNLRMYTINFLSLLIALLIFFNIFIFQVLINPVYESNELGFCIKKTGLKSLLVGETLPNRDYYKTLLQILPDIQTSKPGSWTSKEFPNLTSIINAGKNNLE